MRIDKFLWCVRFYKTRSLATNACKKGMVKVNNQVVKASREVYPNEKITVRIKQVNYRFIIIKIPKGRIGAKLLDIYRSDNTPKSEFEAQVRLKYSKDYYITKGKGRPTKKSRRDIEDYLDFDNN